MDGGGLPIYLLSGEEGRDKIMDGRYVDIRLFCLDFFFLRVIVAGIAWLGFIIFSLENGITKESVVLVAVCTWTIEREMELEKVMCVDK